MIVLIKGHETASGAYLLLSENTVRTVEGNRWLASSSATDALIVPRVADRGGSHRLFLGSASGPGPDADIALAMGCGEDTGNPD